MIFTWSCFSPPYSQLPKPLEDLQLTDTCPYRRGKRPCMSMLDGMNGFDFYFALLHAVFVIFIKPSLFNDILAQWISHLFPILSCLFLLHQALHWETWLESRGGHLNEFCSSLKIHYMRRATRWTWEVVIVVKTGHDITWMETFLITMRARENTGLRRSQQILFFILLHGNHACLFNYFSLQEEENRLFWYQFVSSPSDSDTSHIIFISPEVELKKQRFSFVWFELWHVWGSFCSEDSFVDAASAFKDIKIISWCNVIGLFSCLRTPLRLSLK